MPDFDLASDLALLREAVAQGGAIAMEFFGGRFEVREKSKGDPVTEADLAVDARLQQILIGARPDDAWLSEESGESADRLNTRRLWIVDPIDGTKAFVKAEKDFTVCAALAIDGRSVLGAVFAPARDLMFTACLGQGAWLNGQKIKVSGATDLEGCRMLAPKGMLRHPSWVTPWPAMHVESRSSIAYRVALVARGEFDAAMTLSPTNEWDLAAADIILSEAGGQLTTHTGDAYQYNKPNPRIASMVASAPGLASSILARTSTITLPGNTRP